MLTSAAEVYFSDYPDPALKRTFDAIMTATAGYAARRNEIAHGTVRWSTGESGEREYFLVSPFYNTNKMKWVTGSVYAYTAMQIFSYEGRFWDLYAELDGFYWRLTARIAAREAYGGKLSPAQIARLDRLLLNPTGQTPLQLLQAYRL